jgi:hypothetical protein
MTDDGGDKALASAKAGLSGEQEKWRNAVFAWLDVEWVQYADQKNGKYREAQKETWDYDYWLDIITNYLGRARMFGLETPEGRQALLKGIAAHIDCGAWAIEKYGKPPMPGHPSGEIIT